MSSSPPVSTSTEQRLLAAIVFTDVAGFTTRVEKDEAGTLALLERDFVTMRLFRTMHAGTIIKSTGDGLLLYFTSAVEAVEWALKTQRHLADQSARLASHEILQHRIGIHLGEIFLGGGDIMGDGVNVAARVQAEARPGGICISQVVYGVVKNKLKLDVIRLEPRKLKNVGEALQMYHVLLEPPAHRPPPVAAPQPVKAAVVLRKPRTARNLSLLALLVVGLSLAGALLYRAHLRHQEGLAVSEAERNAFAAALRSETPAPAAPAPVAEPVAAPAIATVPAAPAPEEFDFLKLTLTKPTTPAEMKLQEAARKKAEEHLPALEAWRVSALRRYTRESPLPLRALRPGTSRQTQVYFESEQQLKVVEGGATVTRAWQNLSIDTQGAIIASLLAGTSGIIPPEIARGAEAFAFVNGLPEMAALLTR